jgi:radical SAM/Cys-rich protein
MDSLSLITVDRTRHHEFDERIAMATGSPLKACALDTVQVNIGLTCDLACRHCHVESSPKRTEQMDWPTMELVLSAARRCNARTLDITGGAPEMNPHFRRFVEAARNADLHVIVRTNLTILLEGEYDDLPEFYRLKRVHLIASLPCYLSENVDQQRGAHVYQCSIQAIRVLNTVGYGVDPDLPLDLVYNPIGPALPPEQLKLEQDYRRELGARFGIQFTRLITITNMPIGRFLHDLQLDGRHERYQTLLRQSFNPETVDGLMCRRQIHIGWDGTLHDCDFNYALAMSTLLPAPRHIRDFDPVQIVERKISTGSHCFGCTAGHGSSCGGALV